MPYGIADRMTRVVDSRIQIRGRQVFEEHCFDIFGVWAGQVCPAKGGFGAGKAEITPFRLENRVFYRFLHFLVMIVC